MTAATPDRGTGDTLPVGSAATTPARPDRGRRFAALLKTNLLYDALAIPNLGVEIPVGGRWTVSADWMCAWWSSRPRRRYWRVYGGDVALKYKVGRDPHPFTGHHIGAYASLLSYDIQRGRSHSGMLSDRYNYAAGLRYDFTYPLSRCLAIDFSIGVGYLWGYYERHRPIDDHDVWTSTRRLHWFGPTHAGVSLVWMIGGKDRPFRKGGER